MDRQESATRHHIEIGVKKHGHDLELAFTGYSNTVLLRIVAGILSQGNLSDSLWHLVELSRTSKENLQYHCSLLLGILAGGIE